jgi:ribosome-associated toxin RatA of RatAB toxin-antitoxin module
MSEHHASVTVNAPVHQVYSLFSHFNDFPKFMSFVKEVTYYDNQRSHWVAEVVGRHEWDAVNDSWAEDRQIGWRSTNGLENNGRVTFQPVGSDQTLVDVYINYNPPAGVLGDVGDTLGGGQRFDNALQNDLNNFARMVDQAPPGALDPESSNYLFHSGSAAAKGTTTSRQNATMDDDSANQGSTMSQDYPTDRPVLDRDIIGETANTGTSVDYGTTGTTTSPDYGTSNPVMPPETGTVSNPVMPPDAGTSNPVMPPERNRDTGY